jgi:hypothetical protein
MQERKFLGVVQAAARLGIDEGDLAGRRHALCEPERAIGLAAAGCAGERDQQRDGFADGGSEVECHVSLPSDA